MRLAYWFWLFAAQSVWAAGYVAMKLAGAEMPVGVVVLLRYGIASLVLVAALPWIGLPRLERRDWVLVGALGVLNFALAPTLQVSSLLYTQAIDVSILIALEPLMTVALAALAIHERPSGATLTALLVGTAGMLVLSGVGFGGSATGASNRLLGNSLFTLSLLCESSVTVAGRRLAPRYPAMQVVFAMKAAGFLVAVAVFGNLMGDVDFGAVSPEAWGSILFLSLLSSIFAYTVWYRVIKVVPVNHVALSLFFQPVVGTLIGYTFLGETIGAQSLIGAVLVVASLAWWQVRAAQGRDL